MLCIINDGYSCLISFITEGKFEDEYERELLNSNRNER